MKKLVSGVTGIGPMYSQLFVMGSINTALEAIASSSGKNALRLPLKKRFEQKKQSDVFRSCTRSNISNV